MDEQRLVRIERLLEELLDEAEKIDPNCRGNNGDTHALRETLMSFCHVATEKCRQIKDRPRVLRETLARVCGAFLLLCRRIGRHRTQ